MADDDLKNPHVRALRDLALSYPESTESFPWGHRVIKVREKSFVFFGGEEGSIGISVKLPQSAEAALSLPFTEPTGYGLGKSGWVSARFPAGEALPVPILAAWIDESYRAIAPKTLVARIGGGPAVKAAPATARRASPKKAAVSAAKPVAVPAKRAAPKKAAKPVAVPAKPASPKKATASAPKGTSARMSGAAGRSKRTDK